MYRKIFKTNKNSRPHNWLIHHYSILAVETNKQFLKGRVLDIGCGIKPYKEVIESVTDTYIGLDHINSIHGSTDVDIMGNAIALPFCDATFDSIVSFQVLEHISEPSQFLSEAHRTLKNDCYMLLTTPFIWGEHEQPYDYYRFTRYGLEYLTKKAGFDVIFIKPETGYWSSAILRFNYWINRIGKGFLKYILSIVWLDQYIAYILDRIDRSYTVDTSTFTVLLRKPNYNSVDFHT